MIRSALIGLAFGLALSGGPAAAQGGTSPTLTLAEAIARAAQHDPAVIQAAGGVSSAGATVRSAKGAFLPSLSGSASGGTNFSQGEDRVDPITGEVISGSNTSKSLGFGLSTGIDLFTGFRRGADLRAANAGRDQAEAGLSVQEARSALTTSQQFFEALAASELVRAREASVQREQEKLLIAVARLSTRASTISDSLNAVVSLAEARLQLLNQQSRLATAEANLGRLVGMDGRVAARTDPSLEHFDLIIDASALMAEASAHAPAVLQADAQARAADARYAASKSAYWPTIRLSGSSSWSGSDRNDYALFNRRDLTIGVTVPLFNNFVREQNVATQRANADAALASAEDARRQVLAQLTSQIAALETAKERVSVSALGVDAARANVAVQLERYRLGSIQISELGLAQDALNRAEEQAVSARTEYLTAKAQIESILGRPLQ